MSGSSSTENGARSRDMPSWCHASLSANRGAISMRTSHGTAERYRPIFWRRQLVHTSVALGLLGVSLALGMWGYEHFEHLHWRDAFLNAAMLLGGMGPVKT